MNGPTFVTLVIVIAIIALATWRTYKMVKNHDLCAFCDHPCGCCGNPINCTIRKDE